MKALLSILALVTISAHAQQDDQKKKLDLSTLYKSPSTSTSTLKIQKKKTMEGYSEIDMSQFDDVDKPSKTQLSTAATCTTEGGIVYRSTDVAGFNKCIKQTEREHTRGDIRARDISQPDKTKPAQSFEVQYSED